MLFPCPSDPSNNIVYTANRHFLCCSQNVKYCDLSEFRGKRRNIRSGRVCYTVRNRTQGSSRQGRPSILWKGWTHRENLAFRRVPGTELRGRFWGLGHSPLLAEQPVPIALLNDSPSKGVSLCLVFTSEVFPALPRMEQCLLVRRPPVLR